MDDVQTGQSANRADVLAQVLGCGGHAEKPLVGHLDQGDWAAECTDAPCAVMEAALSHLVQNKVEAAYARSDLFERRRQLMEEGGLHGRPAFQRTGDATVQRNGGRADSRPRTASKRANQRTGRS